MKNWLSTQETKHINKLSVIIAKCYGLVNNAHTRSVSKVSKPDWNIGYTTREHLCLDLDDTSYFKALRLVDMVMRNYPEVGNAVILQSSFNDLLEKWIYPVMEQPILLTKRANYHVIFNNLIGYERCCYIIEALAHLNVISEAYVRIRQMRNDMTLRVTRTVNMKGVKPKPKMLKYVINPYATKQDNGIWLYMQLYKAI